MASVRNALFLFAFVVVVGGVDSAAFQQSDYNKHRSSSVWSVKMSPVDMLSLWKNDNENAADVSGVKGCCVSDVWASTMFTEMRDEEGERKEITHCKNVISVDPVTRRWADDSTVNNEATISQIIICDGSGSSWYNFSKTDRWCTARRESGCPLRRDPWCFASNGTLAGSFSFGAGPGALRTQLWTYLSRYSQGETSFDVLLTPDNCAPILVAERTKDSSKRTATHITASLFTNFTTFIPDPSVFTPPSYC